LTENNNKSVFGRELAGRIMQETDFLIITHIFPDGDAIGSLTSFHSLVVSLGKNSQMVCNSELPYQYSFLPGYGEIKSADRIKDIDKKRYTCIVLDCADEERTGMDLGSLRAAGSFIINIDHHKSNDLFGDINIVDSQKAATTEMLFNFIDNFFGDIMDHEIALGIYVGILTDTGRFQYSNTTSDVHYIAGKLLEYGIYPAEVYAHIYENDPLGRFGLIRAVFKRIEFIEPLGLIYSYVLEKDFKRLGIPYYSQDGIIELLRSARGAEVTALIKQIGHYSYRISLRTSAGNIDLSSIAAGFGGGGHRTASAYKDTGRLKQVIERLKHAVGRESGR
jgi:bifunctional oligoribonuclease and PAP phosphatase NrnA